MAAADGATAWIAASFWHDHGDEIVGAAITLAIAFLVAGLLRRFLDRRGRMIANAVARGDLSPTVDTRLRFARRLLTATVLLIGVFSAAAEFTEVDRIATALLTSGAIAAAVIGLAARQVLGNFLAGIVLAITQPIRIGDWVRIDDHTGVVEDITLNYTVLRTPAGQRVVIPNERLATNTLRNDTLRAQAIGLDVSVWIPPEADAERARDVLADELGQRPAIAEQVPWGTRLALPAEPVAPPERWQAETELRARALRRLRAEGLLPRPGAPS